MMYTRLSPNKKPLPQDVDLQLVVQFHQPPSGPVLNQLRAAYGFSILSGSGDRYHCSFGIVPYARVDEIIRQMNLEKVVRKVLLLP